MDKMRHAYSFKTRLIRVLARVIRWVFFCFRLLPVGSEIGTNSFQVLLVRRGVYVDCSFMNAVAPIPLIAMRVKPRMEILGDLLIPFEALDLKARVSL